MSVVGIECGLEDEIFVREPPNDLKGDDIQKLSVIQALPQLLQTEPNGTYQRVIPKILQELPNSSCEVHIVTSKVFLILMEKSVSVNLLNAVLQGIGSKDPIVSTCWMDTLLGVIKVLDQQQIKRQIIPLAKAKSVLTQPVHSRIASCKLVGQLATLKLMESSDVKRDLLPITQSLCQDCHPEVRKEMCTQLPVVVKGLGTTFLKTNLMVLLVELASDDNNCVRAAALSTTVQIFPYTSQDVKRTTLLPLVKQFCEKGLIAEDVTSITVAKEIGNLVEGLQSVLSASEMLWFLHCYRTLARNGLTLDSLTRRSMDRDTSTDVMCRHYCAQNLPSIVNFTLSRIPSQIDFLYLIVKDLTNDPCYIVRRTVAKDFDVIVKLFDEHTNMLKPELVRLIRDDSEDVLQMIVPCLGKILSLLGVSETLSRQHLSPSTTYVGRALLKCHFELSKGYNWRLLMKLMGSFETLPVCMPPEYIHQNFTPVVLSSSLKCRAKPVRSQAIRTLLVFLRYNNKEMQRKWLRGSLIAQFCYSKNCYTRNVFIRMCVNALEIFSKKYFKEHFYNALLDLADDPVPNVRLCVARLFCPLKEMLVYPEDKVIGDRLDKIFLKYAQEEKDRDVLEMYTKQTIKLRKTIGTHKPELDKEDKKRAEEEENIVSGTSKMALPNIRNKSFSKSSETLRGLDPMTPNYIRRGSGSRMPYDHNFLQQHFYIDAGINLPTTSGNSDKLELLSSKSSNLDLPLTEDSLMVEKLNMSENITDDEKVTLRRLTKKENYDKHTKRHSSVISISCLQESRGKKRINRLSLNLKLKEGSRIPVLSKSSSSNQPGSQVLEKITTSKGEVERNKGANNCSDIRSKVVLHSNGANSRLKTSSLPMLKK